MPNDKIVKKIIKEFERLPLGILRFFVRNVSVRKYTFRQYAFVYNYCKINPGGGSLIIMTYLATTSHDGMKGYV